MKNFGRVTDSKDLVTKEYVDQKLSGGGTGGFEKEIIDEWTVIKYADGTCEGYKDVMASGTIAALGTSGTLAAVGYMAINAENPPASITTERAWADLVQTDGWGWIARMAGGASSAYRFLTFGSGGATRNIIVRWSFTGTY